MSTNGDSTINELVNSLSMFCKTRFAKIKHDEYSVTSSIRELFNDLSENMGVAGLSLSEQYGGLGFKGKEIAELIETIAYHDLGPAVFISVHNMVAKQLEQFGTTPYIKSLLPQLACGKLMAAFALTEPQSGSDAKNIASKLTPDGDDFKLDGTKIYITSAGVADVYIVFAKLVGATNKATAVIVHKDDPGLLIGPFEKKMGCELSPIASLTFDKIKIPRDRIVGNIDQGFEVAFSGLAGGRVNIAACANGISKKAIELALAYSKERKQFNQRIFDFQAIGFMLADMEMKYRAARTLTKEAGEAISNGSNRREIALATSTAKCVATDNCMAITTDAVQIFGGAGYIADYGVEKLMRDAKMLQIVEGTNQIQRHIVASVLAE